MKKDNIHGSTPSQPGFSATQRFTGATSPLRSFFPGKWLAWIVLLASLTATFFAWYLARGIEMERANDRFIFRAKTIESALRERLYACEFLLQSGAGLFAGSEEVTRTQWRTYVTALQIDQHYPGVQGLGFAKIILPSEKQTHIRQIREEGFPNYEIQPAGERPEYTSILFLEPFDWRNQRAFGYDMFSEPTRKEAMEMARDTGSAALSGKVSLLQETEKDVQAGFLMYLPVYRNGEAPATPEQRREALTGYIYSPFRMNDFMQGLLIEKLEYVELQIFDGDKEALLYPSGSMDALSHYSHVHFATYQSILEFAGRHWLLEFKSSPYFEETIDPGQVNSLLLLGIIISLLLFAGVWSLTKSRDQALSLANMTLDLEKANLELRREIEERKQAEEKILHLASFPRLNPNPVIELDSAGEISFLNPATERMFPGLGTMGQSHPLLHDSMEMIADLRQGKKQGGIITESTIDEATFELHISHVQDVNRIRIYVVDITKRKQGEDELREKELLLSESQRLGHIGSFLFNMTGPIQWSDELYRIYGVSPDTFIPTVESFLSMIHPDDRTSMEIWIAACVAGKKPNALDFRINMPDGTIRFIRGDGEAVLDEHNRFLYLAGTGQDITESKQAEQTTIDERNFSNTLIASQPDIFYVLDPTGRFIRWNDKLKDMLGYSDSQIAATNALDIIHEADRLVVAQKTQETFEQGTATNVARLVTKTGIRDFILTATRVDTAKGPIAIGVGTDITERKQAEEELQRYSAELERKNQELQEALAKVKQLTGMLPICASCKKIRDDKGYWSGVETYVSKHTDAVFSHGLCPECEKKGNEDLENLIRENK